MKIDYDRRTITFRQSDLETYSYCPERARRKWFEDFPDPNSDATVTGTAFHYVVEQNLSSRKDGFGPIALDEMIPMAKWEYNRIEEEEGLRYVKGTKEDAFAYLEMMIPAWRAYIEPYVVVDENMLLEEHFNVHLMWWGGVSGHDWEIRLAGTPDCVDRYKIWDWKSAASGYKQWERQRWAIQPTVYAHAAESLGLLSYPIQFNYGTCQKLKTKERAEIIPVMRTADHVDWLCRQIDSLLRMWDRQGTEGPWPMVDSHALCSEKWCPQWGVCKGANIPLGTFLWKPQ